MSSPESKPTPAQVPPSNASAETVSARADAERAIQEFKSLQNEMTDEQAKRAYARLIIGRGFHRPKTGSLIHTTLVSTGLVTTETQAEPIAEVPETAPLPEAQKVKPPEAPKPPTTNRASFIEFLRDFEFSNLFLRSA